MQAFVVAYVLSLERKKEVWIYIPYARKRVVSTQLWIIIGKHGAALERAYMIDVVATRLSRW
jgi:hypothetical protein